MSPLNVRRYRAERLLRGEFEAMRARVLNTLRARLAAAGVKLDECDLEACYSLAWHGLYTAVLEGQEIANPGGWLVLVSFRRAIEEHRSRRCRGELGGRGDGEGLPRGGSIGGRPERDMAGELDDRVRLRQLFEGLRGRLSEREREAAVLCYLQGLTRAEAAARMGVSEARMRKLMEGAGSRRPGVAAKMGELVETIRAGDWCEEQGSLMRGLAFGILDPGGERHRLALAHSGECPACRAYVASLRGLAAVLPPVFIPSGLGAGQLAGRHGHTLGGGASAHAGTAAGASTGAGGSLGAGAGAGTGSGVGAGLAAPAVSVGGAAGGGWLMTGGPIAAKLAVGCLLALGVGASCVELGGAGGHGRPPARGHRRSRVDPASVSASAARGSYASPPASTLPASSARPGGAAAATSARISAAARASREFGPETGASAPAQVSASTGASARLARVSASTPSASADSTAPTAQAAPVGSVSAGGASQATREFSPG
jgi:DNA-directed RNA polymerase specialized sigma24 family protein